MVEGKRALSDRLRGMSFMKRREERQIRTQLATAEASTAVASAASPPNTSAEPGAAGPLIVVEGGTGGSALGAGRAGRRSFGQFNTAVERDFAIAVRQTLSAEPDAEEKLRHDAAVQYQRWKLRNVSGAISGTKLGKGIEKASTFAISKQRRELANVLSASVQRDAQAENGHVQSTLVSSKDSSDSCGDDGEISEENDVDNGEDTLPLERRMRQVRTGKRAPAPKGAQAEQAISPELSSPRLTRGSDVHHQTARPFKKPKL